MKKLQAEWQASGPVPRPDTRVVWKRFRDACDKFFTRRNEDLAQRKEVWSTNQARKEALCARAEELAESRDWDKAASELRRLQADWKTVGPVRRTKSEALWQRFRTAADRFFERYKRRDEIEIESRQADREALAVELESFLPAEGAEAVAPPDLLEKVRSLRTRWNQSTTAVRQGADPLSGRFMSAMERVLTTYPDAFKSSELDVDASRRRMEKLVAQARELRVGERGEAGVVDRIWPRGCAKRWRPTRSAAAPAPNPSGAAWPTKCARRSRRSHAWCRCRARPARSSPTASTRPATGSSISTAARSRRSRPRRSSAAGRSGPVDHPRHG